MDMHGHWLGLDQSTEKQLMSNEGGKMQLIPLVFFQESMTAYPLRLHKLKHPCELLVYFDK